MVKLFRNLAVAAGLLLAATVPAAAGRLQTAVFAGGCFWSMEHDMRPIPGVVGVLAGYTGGHVQHPTYEQVVTETTGHYESVQITYDPAKISYPLLVARYLRVTDPTDGRGQFCDYGPSYRPAIFVANEDERRMAQAVIAQTQTHLRARIVTQVLPRQTFWPAEGYHQNYAAKNPGAYGLYRTGCGKDAKLRAVWGS